MRLLLTCLFLVVMQSFVVCTKEDGGLTFASKSVDAIEQTRKTTPILATKQANKLVQIQSFKALERIHQHISKHSSLAKNAILTKNNLLIITFKTIERIKNKVDFSYQYIFNCLYPKYTFW